MAEIFVDEGLDHILSIWPVDGANDVTLYVGFFTSQTPTTVPTRAAQNVGPVGWTEAAGVNYARQPITDFTWGAPFTSGSGRRVTAPQVTFPVVGAGGWGVVNGFFLSTAIDQASGVIVFFANFDDLTAKPMNVGSQERVTASLQFDG